MNPAAGKVPYNQRVELVIAKEIVAPPTTEPSEQPSQDPSEQPTDPAPTDESSK